MLRASARKPLLVWSGTAAVALVVAGAIVGLGWQQVAEGLPDAGPLVVDAIPVLRLITVLAGAGLLGFLCSAVLLDPGARGECLGPEGLRDMRWASGMAGVLALASASMSLLTLADVLGMTLGELGAPGVVQTYLWDVPTSRAHLVTACLAVLICLAVPRARSLTAGAAWMVVAGVAVGLPSLAGHAAGLGSHALALVSGFGHAVTASLWVGGVVTIAAHRAWGTPELGERIRRFGAVALVGVVALLVTGFASAATRLGSPGELLTSTFGHVLLLKTLAMLVGLAMAMTMRRRPPGPARSRLLLVELGALGTALGLAVVLARTPFPRVGVELATLGEELIGYPYPPAPTVAAVALGWHPDWVWLTTALLAMGLYGAAFARLRVRGDRWPAGRLVSWVSGWLVVIWATCSGIAWYAPVSFALHMVSHMALAMLAPILLVLGGPTTLALRALPGASGGVRGPREWLVLALNSRVTRFLTHPGYVLVVFTVGLYGLYYTDLYARLMSWHLGHLAMQVHFLLAGYLFYWVVIGVDPAPRQLPHPVRLMLVMVSIVIHSLFALPMMMSSTPMVPDWYAVVSPPWLDALADSHNAGAIAWGLGEIPALVVAVALAFQWASSDDRRARRLDRRADRDGDLDLRAYNAKLEALNDQARRGD